MLPITKKQWLLLLSIIIVLMIDGLDTQLLALVAPIVIDEWGVSKAAFGLALSAALVGMTFGAAISGRLCTRYGPSRMLIYATFLFGSATLLAATAYNIETLAAIRLVSGLGFGAASVAGFALAADCFPQNVRAKVSGLLTVSMPLGMSLCALMITTVLSFGGWRLAFVICGAFTLCYAALLAIFLPESPIFLALRGSGEASTESQEEDKGDRHIFQPPLRRLTLGCGLLYLVSATATYGLGSFTPLFLTMRNYPLADGIAGAFWVSLLGAVSALLMPLVIHRFGSKPLLIACCIGAFAAVLFVAANVATAGAPPSPALRQMVVAAIGISGGFTSACIPITLAILSVQFPAASRPAGIGFGIMMGRIGGVIMLLTGGALLTLLPGTTLPLFVVLALCSIVGIAATLIVDRHIMPHGPSETIASKAAR